MRNILYYVACILIIGWAIGVIGYGLGGLIHVLFVLAIVSILLKWIQGGKIF